MPAGDEVPGVRQHHPVVGLDDVPDGAAQLGSTIRLIIRRVVVLPQPEDPTRTVTPPSGMSRERSWTAVVPLGKRLWAVSDWIMRFPCPAV
ncbi:hypothetical protein ADK35_14335 [Streptomyces viridochromogenes]|nr:hypothetical protein ADK36_18925 [Streptomyces viridochromogenes]KOG23038.1 hypothetical protein ADK35_14335 [Streptomyces viridochromogenes]